MKLNVKISPCPNDTFMFDAMVNGRVETEGLEFDLQFDDIEGLNMGVVRGDVDISKISYAAFASVADRYSIIDSGSALGSGNGPLLVGLPGVDMDRTYLKVAVPGLHTTANMLMDRFFPLLTDKTPILFSQIASGLVQGKFDCGVLIHEGRFTYKEQGLSLIADLGQLWEQRSGVPLPLGAIAISNRVPNDVAHRFERVLRRSIEFAIVNPRASAGFVRCHAAEMSQAVTDSHIALFVNSFSLSLGEKGKGAVAQFLGMEQDDIFLK